MMCIDLKKSFIIVLTVWVVILVSQRNLDTAKFMLTGSEETYADVFEEYEAINMSDLNVHTEGHVHGNSYVSRDTYAGVVLEDMLMHSDSANPASIMEDFNRHIFNEGLLKNEAILDYNNLDEATQSLRTHLLQMNDELETYLEDVEIDASWFDKIAIGNEGLIVILEKYDYFPDHIAPLVVILPYEELGNSLLIAWDLENETAENGPEPHPIPELQMGERLDLDPQRPMIALTFDDGPGRYTPQILDLLEQHGARATFFVAGNLVEDRSDTVARAADAGHEILGHSWSHRDFTKLSDEDIRTEIFDTNAEIEAVTGSSSHMFRLPYGSSNKHVQDVVGDLGFVMIGWSLDSRDWYHKNADKVYEAIMKDANDGDIVLLHDIHASTAQVMERVIPDLVANGYQIVTISELLIYRNVSITPGEIITNGN